MQDAVGKLLEKLIKSRLIDAIRAAGDYSSTQYGFRAGRTTINAIDEVVQAVNLVKLPLLASGALFDLKHKKYFQFCEVVPHA